MLQGTFTELFTNPVPSFLLRTNRNLHFDIKSGQCSLPMPITGSLTAEIEMAEVSTPEYVACLGVYTLDPRLNPKYGAVTATYALTNA